MSHLELDDDLEPRTKTATLARILDPAFGFFVFAAHLLVIYVAQAVACALGLGGAGAGAHTSLLTVLAILTLGAALVLGVHGVLRYRRFRSVPEQRFRLAMTLGNDAIAATAILLQLFPILMMPLCA